MKKATILIIALILTATRQSFSQKQGQELIDSLNTVLQGMKENADTNKANLLISLARASMSNSEFEKSIEYCKQALSLSEKLKFKKGQSNAYHTMGNAYNNLGNYSEALKNDFAALKIREAMGDKRGIAGTSNNIGLVFMYQGNYPEALKMFFKALKINEEIDNKDWIATNYNNIGIIFYIQKQYPEALQYLRAELKIYDELGDRPSQNYAYNDIGNVYYGQGNYTEALKNYNTALQIRREIGDLYEVGNSLGNLGVSYEMLGNYSEALKNHFAALKIANEIGNKDGKAVTCNNIADVKFKMKKYVEAKQYYDSAFAISKEIGSIESIKQYYHGIANLDSALGDYKNSLKHYKLFIQYRDSLVNDENNKQLVQQQMQYDFDKKEAATKAEQDKKDAVAQKELQKQKLVRNGFVGGFALVLLFAGVFFSQRNKISKGKKRSDELLLNILPEEVAEELKTKGSADAKQFDEVTVLFTDFKNFTGVSERLSPQELVNEINYCYSSFDKIISKYGIEKIKTIGDSYMCAGGLPVPTKTNAVDTLNAAMEIRDFMLSEKQKRETAGKTFFEIRIGLHTGAVVAGIVGIKKFAYDIWGDTVNIASRMESGGEAGKVNISGATYELVKEKFTCIHRGKIQAKNKGEIDMYFVEEMRS